jgi:hypothetical protein
MWARGLRFYIQAGGGIGIGHTKLVDENDREFTDFSTGIALTGSAGVDWSTPWWPQLGIGLGLTFMFQPVITNLTDDRHLGVGGFIDLSGQYRF